VKEELVKEELLLSSMRLMMKHLMNRQMGLVMRSHWQQKKLQMTWFKIIKIGLFGFLKFGNFIV